MLKDHDLVIIGNTSLSRYTALAAIKINYRVALVEQPFSQQREGIDIFYRQKLLYLSRFSRQYQTLQSWQMIPSLSEFNFSSPNTVEWWQRQYEEISLQQLAEKGVDVILEAGKFETGTQSELSFVTETRHLLAENYLIATGYSNSNTDIQGLSEVGYLDLIDVCHQMKHLPKNLVILAETITGVELAQALNRLGKNVTLIIEDSCLLPQEEREIVAYLQAQLEAEGIKLFVDTPVTHVRLIEQQKWIEIRGHAIAADELIITSYPQPNLQDLNLDKVKVNFDKKGIRVNKNQQTNLPNVYAIGGVTGKFKEIAMAQIDAENVLNNIMRISNRKQQSIGKINIILTDPSFIRIGLTEAEAKEQYSDKIIIVNLNFHPLCQSQLLDEKTGKIKIITRLNGQILGVHILGYYSEEYINAIAIAMQQKIPLVKLKSSALTSASFAYILSQAALQWQQKKIKYYQQWPKFIQRWLISRL